MKCADYGFTQSHQVILDLGDQERIDQLASNLEEANIIADRGMRFGTSELTRRGMKLREMEKIAEMVAGVYKGEDPAKVRRVATKLRKSFRSTLYT